MISEGDKVAFVGYNWNKQYALEEDGTMWPFDALIDFEGDEIVTSDEFPAEHDEVACIVVKHPTMEAWATIDLSEFEDKNEN